MFKYFNKITTADMEVALAFSNSSPCDIRKNTITVVRCKELFGHETDVVSITESGYATEVEIKISKADFNKDFKKEHCHESGYIKYFYYAVPYYMVDYVLDKLPEDAGLLSMTPDNKYCGRIKIVKSALAKKNVRKITEKMLAKMQRYMSMRYWSVLKRTRKYFWDQIVEDFKQEKKLKRKRDLNHLK